MLLANILLKPLVESDMNRRQQKVLKQFLLSMTFLAFLYFVVLPWYMGRIQKAGNDFLQQSEQNYQQTMANVKAQQQRQEQERLDQAMKPVYVEKIHQGYTTKRAEIRTCANIHCTVVGHLDKETMVKWNEVENGFINYDSAYYIKIADVKQLF
nr:hypothetical protein [Moraxella sp. CTOTU48268]